VTALERRAYTWIEPYWNADHLVRTRDWLLVLEPAAEEALRLASLTHDMERHFPGGPRLDPARMAPDDADYQRAHCDRSARIVADWLRGEGAADRVVAEVARLVGAHEFGGERQSDLLQAADSISFLEVNRDLPYRWAREGRCSTSRAADQHRWMFERIRLPHARQLARPFYERAVSSAA
jgi:hypothetical protein